MTAFDHFAVRAQAGVADYLQNPSIAIASTARCAARRITIMRWTPSSVTELQAVVGIRTTEETSNRFQTEFWLRAQAASSGANRRHRFGSKDDYVAIHAPLAADAQFNPSSEQRVEPGHFIRSHSLVVGERHIAEIRTPRMGGAEILLRTGERIPVGRVYLRALRRGM